jgi:hypothetical protein
MCVLGRRRMKADAVADQADVRRIALSLPETVEDQVRIAFGVLDRGRAKGIVWVWMERVEPRKPRVPRPDVVAVRVSGQAEKELLLASDSDKFFTEAHYNVFQRCWFACLPSVSRSWKS